MRPLLALLLGIVLLAQPRGAIAAQDLLPSIQRIVERGTLVIAVIEGSRPPMVKRGQDGKLSGFDVELGQDIARTLGVEAKFVPSGANSNDVIEKVASGEADIGLSYLSESVKAGMRVFFSRPYIVEAHTVFINRTKGMEFDVDCPSASKLIRLAKTPGSLGVLDRSPYIKMSEESKPEVFRDMASLVAAVEAGEITLSLQGELSAKHYLSRHPEVSIRLRYCHVPNIHHRVSVAVRPDGIDLLRWLDIYITQRGVIIDLDTLLYRAKRVVY